MAKPGKRAKRARRSSTKAKTTKSKASTRKRLSKKIPEAERKRRKKNRRARQRREELKLAEQIAREETEKQARGLDELDLAIGWAEYMAPVEWEFSLTEPEVASQKRMPFLIVARFDPPSGTTYADLHRVFLRWRDDLVLEAMIHPQRICSIRVIYDDPSQKKGEGDSVVSHAGPWAAVISDIAHEVDPDDEDSLATRYSATTIPTVYVYFSAQIAQANIWIPHYQRG